MATDALSQDLPVRMTALGHLVFVLAFVGITRSTLTVPFWRHLPEVPRQQEMVAEPEDDYQEEDPRQTITSGPLCSGYLSDWFYCLDSGYLPNISPFANIRVSEMLRVK